MIDQSTKDRVKLLLNKSLTGQLSAEERSELDALMANEKYATFVQDYILQAFHQEKPLLDMEDSRREKVWQAIRSLERTTQGETSIRKMLYWRWVAVASIVLLVVTPLLMNISDNPLLTLFVERDSISNAASGEQRIVNTDRMPAREQATLTTFEGKVFQLDQLLTEKTIYLEGLEVTKRNSGDLVFRFKDPSDIEHRTAQGMNTITTPRGGIYHIVLPDGSKVSLNASSRLSFPTSFGDKERLVSLEGEGYFDIATDSTRRFIVRTAKGKQTQDILVFGTEFNVNAYPENDGILTTLVEGRVQVHQQGMEQELLPMQQARAMDGKIDVSTADLEVNLAWKNNMFYFADEPLVNVMAQIGRWYNIDIRYAVNAPQLRLWGQISREKKLSEILEILRQTNDIEFDVKGKEVTVTH